jgi:hypothetical protein
MKKLLFGLSVAAAAVLPLHGQADAAQKCNKYRERDWGYAFCWKGPGDWYWARGRCIYWVGDIGIISIVDGNFARKGIDPSTIWCPDGYHLIRGSRILVFWI